MGSFVSVSTAAIRRSSCCDSIGVEEPREDSRIGTAHSAMFDSEMEIKLFHRAARGDEEGVKQLLESGISVNVVDYNRRSALHIASERGNLGVVQYLLQKKAEVNLLDHGGKSALALAAEHCHQKVVHALENAGAIHFHDKRCEALLSQSTSKLRHASFAVMEAFPQPIAAAMLQGRKVEPVSKDMVSLCFSDIVGFTALSSTMPADKVSDMLHRLFTKFDMLAYLHSVQKVDVIGDCYIAAANFTEQQAADHAARLARFAIDCLRAAGQTPIDSDRPDGPCVQLRLGMHCGPVSARVVGCQCPKYTLMGDTVNMASRMESSGQPGRIQCSAAMAAAIEAQANDVLLRRRHGGAAAKGIGTVDTFWVSSLRDCLHHRAATCPDLSRLLPPGPTAADGADDAPPCGAAHRPFPPQAAARPSADGEDLNLPAGRPAGPADTGCPALRRTAAGGGPACGSCAQASSGEAVGSAAGGVTGAAAAAVGTCQCNMDMPMRRVKSAGGAATEAWLDAQWTPETVAAAAAAAVTAAVTAPSDAVVTRGTRPAGWLRMRSQVFRRP